MKLLLDQNLSFRIVGQLTEFFPEVNQVRQLGLENHTDIQIWDFAKTNGYTIVTFDADFYDLVTLYGHPPKVIWLRFGNTSTNHLISLLQAHKAIIEQFINDPSYAEVGCLEINRFS